MPEVEPAHDFGKNTAYIACSIIGYDALCIDAVLPEEAQRPDYESGTGLGRAIIERLGTDHA
jgi:hypothetical protein